MLPPGGLGIPRRNAITTGCSLEAGLTEPLQEARPLVGFVADGQALLELVDKDHHPPGGRRRAPGQARRSASTLGRAPGVMTIVSHVPARRAFAHFRSKVWRELPTTCHFPKVGTWTATKPPDRTCLTNSSTNSSRPKKRARYRRLS